jgi:hypothetical protein
MTWVSTVSPRALDRLMEEAVPAASVCPTLTRLEETQTGNAEPDDRLAVMKIERTTIAAAACGRAFAWRKVLRASSPLRLTDLSSLFVGILRAPKFIFGPGEIQSHKGWADWQGDSLALNPFGSSDCDISGASLLVGPGR